MNPQVASKPSGDDVSPTVAAIRLHGDMLRSLPHVLGVRPGYRMLGGDLTKTPAIVVVVDWKAAPETLREADVIPQSLDGIRVDVQEATILERVEGIPSLAYWEKLISGVAAEAAPRISYRPPEDSRLDEIHRTNKILCHVGPDASWQVLEPFLEGTRETLSVAMYEFYARHIADIVVETGSNSTAKLDLILQTNGDAERAVVEDLQGAWGDRLAFTPAVVSGPNRVFANSYHTKVAVRDRQAFWLSSGNWSNTSQPVIPPGPQPTIYTNGNREWHVVIENDELAGLFEDFIKWDFDHAKAAGLPEAEPAMPDLLIPESAFLELEAAVVQPTPFRPRKYAATGNRVRVRTLMTPDNYADRVRELIESAEKTLYMQFSYINGPRDNDKFRALLDAVAAKMRAGLDVRILVGRNQDAAHTQRLMELGWDLACMRRQTSKLHNKGILVDSKITVVGSHNWSSDGTQYNRDASIVFYSRPITRYFNTVFQFDWANLSKSVTTREVTPLIATSEATPQGMVRVPWHAWFED
jgi:phosphatidylserine/phosphatidylglycerophosphate/cardiolipin synthase-like enzyme